MSHCQRGITGLTTPSLSRKRLGLINYLDIAKIKLIITVGSKIIISFILRDTIRTDAPIANKFMYILGTDYPITDIELQICSRL